MALISNNTFLGGLLGQVIQVEQDYQRDTTNVRFSIPNQDLANYDMKNAYTQAIQHRISTLSDEKNYLANQLGDLKGLLRKHSPTTVLIALQELEKEQAKW